MILFPVKISINIYFGKKIHFDKQDIFTRMLDAKSSILYLLLLCFLSTSHVLLAADCKTKIADKLFDKTLKYKPLLNGLQSFLTKPIGYCKEESTDASQWSQWECERVGYGPILHLRCKTYNRLTHADSFPKSLPFYAQTGLTLAKQSYWILWKEYSAWYDVINSGSSCVFWHCTEKTGRNGGAASWAGPDVCSKSDG